MIIRLNAAQNGDTFIMNFHICIDMGTNHTSIHIATHSHTLIHSTRRVQISSPILVWIPIFFSSLVCRLIFLSHIFFPFWILAVRQNEISTHIDFVSIRFCHDKPIRRINYFSKMYSHNNPMASITFHLSGLNQTMFWSRRRLLDQRNPRNSLVYYFQWHNHASEIWYRP